MCEKYVYLIQSIEDEKLKIGVSKNPNLRIKNIQTGNGNKIKLIESYLTKYPNKIENILHNRYSYCRKTGEWFEYDLELIVNFKKICRKHEKNIEFLIKNDNFFI
jgi:hypothetical protein